MGYETPISVKELVEGINRKYYLPSIQREFVWDTDRIARLFDSVMKGFPIGSFLFWEVSKDKIEDFRFYEFMRNFHALDNKHNKIAPLTASSPSFTAILDGQQRMTSLYIGLKGTYAEKLKYKSKNNKNNYPVKKLYLNLMNKFDAETADERGLTYDFKFLEPSEAGNANKSGKEHWFEVGEILKSKYGNVNGILGYLRENNLLTSTLAGEILSTLQEKIWHSVPISFYLEKSEELDTVVNIFIRVNSGGVVLSYSDLLLSFATAQLHGVQDFRGDIYNFVDDINDIGGSDNFAFDKDFVLKAILVLCDDIDKMTVKFQTKNFNRQNMLEIHKRWNTVTEAIKQAVSLISSYGFNKTDIISANAVIPIAYYILKKKNNPALYKKDENIIRQWFIIASLGGLFRSSTDNVLIKLRGDIKADNVLFPAQKMLDKNELSLDGIITDILDTEYKDKSITMAMSILYPKVNLANNYHIDHIFPQSKFKKKIFAEKKITDIDFYTDNLNSFANLQLLPASQNQSKNDEFFDDWLKKMSLADREAYMKEHYIPTDIDLSFGNFKEFIQKREELIRQRLKENLKSWNIFI